MQENTYYNFITPGWTTLPLVRACLTCEAYEEAKDFNRRVYDYLRGEFQ